MSQPNLKKEPSRRLSSHLKLTPAEQKTLPFMEQGLTPKEIAAILGITPGTAAIRVMNIRDKLRA